MKPNILILHTDQQRFDTVGAQGGNLPVTPNLDRLAETGQCFTRAYSSSPACMPARHDLLTGASARHHGYWINWDGPMNNETMKTLPRMLGENGYETVALGKMHHYPATKPHGWSQMRLMEEIPVRREDDAYLQYLDQVGYGQVLNPHGVRPLFYHSPQCSRLPKEHHGTAWIAREAIREIEKTRDKPFCIMCSWIGPHPPYSLPREYLDLYREAQLPEPCPRPENDERQYPLSAQKVFPDQDQLARLREAYFGSCAFIDQQIGMVLDTLETAGNAKDTIVIFLSDHGEMLGDRQAFQKFSPYEGSAHIPLIIRGPGFTAGATSKTPVNTWDITATLLEATGIAPPANHPMVGKSLLRELPADRIICFHHGGDPNRINPVFQRCVATVGEGHKFIHFYNGGDEELYNLEDDPYEQKNLIADGAFDQELLARLRQACMDFEQTHGQNDRIRDGSFVDQPYCKPPVSTGSYFGIRTTQFPPWPEKRSDAYHATLIEEMKHCLEADGVCLPKVEKWEGIALRDWAKIGGQTELMANLIDDCKKWERDRQAKMSREKGPRA